MFTHLRRQPYILLLTLLLFACKKNSEVATIQQVPFMEETPDLVSKVHASVSGFVADTNNVPLANASVTAGTAQIKTDRYGYFELNDVEVVRNAATVKIASPGYFTITKTWLATEGRNTFFRIALLPKTQAGVVQSDLGGSVLLSNGASIQLPANGIKTEASGLPYSGPVSVHTAYIDPLRADISNIMPGDLRGLSSSGGMKSLTSYGMLGVELNGAGGELLNVAEGYTAMISLPIPSGITAAKPDSIPLWYFDDRNGLWKEEGMSWKAGNEYKGRVSHFSFWNVDIPNASVALSFSIVNADGVPLPDVNFDISGTTGHINGVTNEDGFVQVSVAANASYKIDLEWGAVHAVDLFPVQTSAIELGNLQVPGFQKFRGTILNCSNMPVVNGRILYLDDDRLRFARIANGEVEAFILGDLPYTTSIIAEDNDAGEYSSSQVTISNYNQSFGAIRACGESTTEFFDLRINGRYFRGTRNDVWTTQLQYEPALNVMETQLRSNFYEIINGVPDTLLQQIYCFLYTEGPVTDPTSRHYSMEVMSWVPNMMQGSMSMYPLQYLGSMNNYKEVPVNMTEYGPVGEFISGSFSGRYYEQNMGQTNFAHPYDVSCSFRVRRTQ